MPQQNKLIEGLLGAPSNPLMNVGMSLLASRYDPSVNPWTTSLESLAMAKKAANLEQDRQRQQKAREEMSKFFRQQSYQQLPGTMSPVAPQANPLMSDFNNSMASQIMQPSMDPTMSMAGNIRQNMAMGGMSPVGQPLTQQQRFGTLPYNQQQYLRNMALRDLFDTGS